MNLIVDEFNDRVKEVDEYIEFISKFEHDKYELIEIQSNTCNKIKKTVYKMLRANIYLLLYNIIEYSFKNSLEHICEKISNNCKYDDVIDSIKKIYLKKEYDLFSESKLSSVRMKRDEYLINKINNISSEVVRIQFNKKSDISGNLDDEKIKEFALIYGFESNIRPITSNKLKMIKNRRNSLSHGDESFSRCGASITIQDIKDIRNQTVSYMEEIFRVIADYIDTEKYKLSHKRTTNI